MSDGDVVCAAPKVEARVRWSRAAASDRALSPLSLPRSFSWTLTGNVVYAASQWAMLTAIAKLGQPELVGQYALALAITAPVMMFANLNLAIVQATDAPRAYRFSDYLGLRTVTSTAALALIAIGLWAAGHSGPTALVIIAVACAKVVESFSDIYYGLFQQRGRMDAVARSLMLKGPLSLGAMAAAVYFTGSVLWGAGLLAITWAGVLFGLDCRAGARIVRFQSDGNDSIGLYWRPRVWGELVLLTLPMGVVALVNALVPNIPRYFVGHELGERALGIFAALAYIIVAGHGVMTALGSSIGPLLAAAYLRRNRGAFISLVFRSTAFGAASGAVLTALAVAFGGPLLTFLYTAEYAAHQREFAVLMIAAIFIYMSHFLWTGVTAARYFRPQAPLFMASIVLSAAACAWLVPRFGLTGAALAVLVTAMFQFAGMASVLAVAIRHCEPAAGGSADLL